jgi:hypothetical protein
MVTRRVILQKARDHRAAQATLAAYGSHCMDAVGFRFYFTPLAGVLFTVPSRYCALSVTTSRLPWTVGGPASHGISRVPWYLSGGVWPGNLDLRDSHPLWCGVPAASVVVTRASGGEAAPPTPAHNPSPATPARLARCWFRQVPFRSPLLREYYHFLGVLRWFSSPGSLPKASLGSARIIVRGLPHSETLGSTPDCGSPSLSLLVCVLHRLVVPRHPPTAHHVLPGHGSLGRRRLAPHAAR